MSELRPDQADFATCAVCGLPTVARLSALPEGESFALHQHCIDQLAAVEGEPEMP